MNLKKHPEYHVVILSFGSSGKTMNFHNEMERKKKFQYTELIKNMKLTNFSPSLILLQLEKNSFGVKGNYWVKKRGTNLTDD